MKCKAMKNEKSLLQSCNRLMVIILSNQSIQIIPNFPSILNIIQYLFPLVIGTSSLRSVTVGSIFILQ